MSLHELNACNSGCRIGSFNVNHLMYADDLVDFKPQQLRFTTSVPFMVLKMTFYVTLIIVLFLFVLRLMGH